MPPTLVIFKNSMASFRSRDPLLSVSVELNLEVASLNWLGEFKGDLFVRPSSCKKKTLVVILMFIWVILRSTVCVSKTWTMGVAIT